ncbi:alkaline phosphatase PhoX [Sulfurovum sp.]|uniref:alkaline phosphatase PhoX n=1 Tax=Sulfurovum sp. TaxID=1969726 RepID=UPI002868349B|nr:alkaline phosphatase PhoX [Sulfurovum sp.]
MKWFVSLVFIVTVACSMVNAKELSFKSIDLPKSSSEKYQLRATDEVKFNGKTQRISFMSLLKTGYRDNAEVYGQLKDRYDQPLVLNREKPYICNGTTNPYGSGSGLDHVTILQKSNKLFMVSQFECQVGAYYINELTQDKQGTLSGKPNTLRFISQKDEFGGYVHCAGMKTPWESHLGSEEYPADARNRDKSGKIDLYYNYVKAYWRGDLLRANPYYYGWTPEIKVDDKGEVLYTKHYSMGRFSHELSYVMPDRKTVYMTDDGTNSGFFMYVAKRAEDLSEGTLYAAKWIQQSTKNGGSAIIDWIKLGEASDREIRAFLDPDNNITSNDGLTFNDIFLTGKSGVECKSGFITINTERGFECLKVKQGMKKAAAFLESRRYAAMMGASTEFRKAEGITFNERSNKLFVSISEVGQGMEDFAKKGSVNDKYDKGGYNDIKLPYNQCGTVYALDVDENYRVEDMKALITGEASDKDSIYSCDIDKIANPDNLTFVKNTSTLIIAEDSHYHENNAVWAYDIKEDRLDRMMTLPKRAEATSPFWYENIGGFSYLLLVTQHPDIKSDNAGESSVGVLGPIKR